MTLRELLKGAYRTCLIWIDVRDNGVLVESYEIGAMARDDIYKGKLREARWTCIPKPINYMDTGKGHWETFIKNIPKKLLDMNVTDWDASVGYRSNNGLNEHIKLRVNLQGKDDYILTEAREETPALEGQISLEDWKGRKNDAI